MRYFVLPITSSFYWLTFNKHLHLLHRINCDRRNRIAEGYFFLLTCVIVYNSLKGPNKAEEITKDLGYCKKLLVELNFQGRCNCWFDSNKIADSLHLENAESIVKLQNVYITNSR